MLPKDTSCEAEYEDGYVHSETNLDDISPYGDGNVFRDILAKRPEVDHGRMVRFSVFYKNKRYDIDWQQLPDNARPIRFRQGFSTISVETGDVLEYGYSGVDLGYQYNDETGTNQQEVMELR